MKTVDEMMEDIRASIKESLKAKPRVGFGFTCSGRTVYRGNETIARVKSHTLARRIAQALNQYVPGPRGY